MLHNLARALETGIDSELIPLPNVVILTDPLNSAAAEAVLPSATLQRTRKANLRSASGGVVSRRVLVVLLR